MTTEQRFEHMVYGLTALINSELEHEEKIDKHLKDAQETVRTDKGTKRAERAMMVFLSEMAHKGFVNNKIDAMCELLILSIEGLDKYKDVAEVSLKIQKQAQESKMESLKFMEECNEATAKMFNEEAQA